MENFINYQDITNRLDTANQIVSEIDNYYAIIQDKACDRHNIGFNVDDRFSSAIIKLSVDCYTHYCGSTSRYIRRIVKDDKVFTTAFIAVLNKHFTDLMMETAQYIKEQALLDKDKAILELQLAIKNLNESK